MGVSIATLYDAVASMEEDYRKRNAAKIAQWQNSLFKYLVFAAPGSKGAEGKKLSALLCSKCGFKVSPRLGKRDQKRNIDFYAENCGVAVKCAFLDELGAYVFEQIRDRGYGILILLGLAPSDAHVWVFRKEECLRHMKSQHGSEVWAHVSPGNPPKWRDLEIDAPCITGQTGKLEDFAAVLRQKITECKNESAK